MPRRPRSVLVAVLLLLVLAHTCAALVIEPQRGLAWAEGSSGQDYGMDVEVLRNGDFILTFSAQGDLPKLGLSGVTSDVCVVARYTSTGSVVWIKRMLEGYTAFVYDLEVTSDEEYVYFAGLTLGAVPDYVDGLPVAIPMGTGYWAPMIGRIRVSDGMLMDRNIAYETVSISQAWWRTMHLIEQDGVTTGVLVVGETFGSDFGGAAPVSSLRRVALGSYSANLAAESVQVISPRPDTDLPGSRGFGILVKSISSSGTVTFEVVYRSLYDSGSGTALCTSGAWEVTRAPDNSLTLGSTASAELANLCLDSLTRKIGADANTYLAVARRPYQPVTVEKADPDVQPETMQLDLVEITTSASETTTFRVLSSNFAKISSSTPGTALGAAPTLAAQHILAVRQDGYIVTALSNSDVLGNSGEARGFASVVFALNPSLAVTSVHRVLLGQGAQDHSGFVSRRVAAAPDASSLVLVGAWHNDLSVADSQLGSGGKHDVQLMVFPLSVTEPVPVWVYIAIAVGAAAVFAMLAYCAVLRWRRRSDGAGTSRKRYRVFDVEHAGNSDSVGSSHSSSHSAQRLTRAQQRAQSRAKKDREREERKERERAEKERKQREKEREKEAAKRAASGGKRGGGHDDGKTTTTVQTVLSGLTSVYGADDDMYGRTVPGAPRDGSTTLLPDNLTTADIVELAGGSNEVPNVPKDAYVANAAPSADTQLIGSGLYPDHDPNFAMTPSEPASPDDDVKGGRLRSKKRDRGKSGKSRVHASPNRRHRYEEDPAGDSEHGGGGKARSGTASSATPTGSEGGRKGSAGRRGHQRGDSESRRGTAASKARKESENVRRVSAGRRDKDRKERSKRRDIVRDADVTDYLSGG